MNIIINTDNNNLSPKFASSNLSLHDIVVSKDLPNVFSPGTTANKYTDSDHLAYVYSLDIHLEKTDALRNLAGFDILVYKDDPGPWAGWPAWFGGGPGPSYEVRTLVSRHELGFSDLPSSISTSGEVKYFSGKADMTVISSSPLSPKSKLLSSHQHKSALNDKQESVLAAASNTVPGLLKTLNNSKSQNTVELNNYLFKNGGSFSDLANSTISTVPLEYSIDKSSLGMDWFAPKDNTNVYLSKGRIVNKSSLLEDRVAAMRVYDDQVSVLVDAVSIPGHGLSDAYKAIVDNTNLYTTPDYEPVGPHVYRKIEIPKGAITSDTIYVVIRPIQIAANSTTSMLWDSFSSSWMSSETPTPFPSSANVTVEANHASMLDSLMNPILPVRIAAVQLASETRVTVTALDPGINSVSVRRLALKRSPTGFTMETATHLIPETSRLSLSLSGVKTSVIVDHEPLVYPYYACYIANNGTSGIESQVVIEGRKNQSTTALSIDSVTIVATNGVDKSAGAMIEVANIPSKARQIKIMRENLSGFGASWEKTVSLKLDSGQDLFTRESSSFEFKDSTAHLGKKYRYFPVLRTDLGVEEICTAEAILIRSYPLRKIPFSLELDDPTVTVAQGQANVSIVANVYTNELAFANLIQLLKDNTDGQATWAEDISNSKSQFPSLAFYKVSRVNVTTGVTTFLEWASPGDVPTSLHPGGWSVDRENPGFTISDTISLTALNQRIFYKFELSLRPPEAFLAGTFSTYADSYSQKIPARRAVTNGFLAEWGYLGALPSTDDILAVANGTMSVEDQIKKGLTGQVVSTAKIQLSPQYPPPVITASYVDEQDNIVIEFSAAGPASAAVPILYKSYLMYKGPGIPVFWGLPEYWVLQTLSSGGKVTVSQYTPLVGTKEYYILYMYQEDAESGGYKELVSDTVTFNKVDSESPNIKAT
jgi:hypothetical protein